MGRGHGCLPRWTRDSEALHTKWLQQLFSALDSLLLSCRCSDMSPAKAHAFLLAANRPTQSRWHQDFGFSSRVPLSQSLSGTEAAVSKGLMDTQQADTHFSASFPGSPTIGSQANARMRLDTPATTLSEVSHLNSSSESLEAKPDAMELFPTNNQPVIDTILKDLLLSLRSFLNQTCSPSCSCLPSCKGSIRKLLP